MRKEEFVLACSLIRATFRQEHEAPLNHSVRTVQLGSREEYVSSPLLFSFWTPACDTVGHLASVNLEAPSQSAHGNSKSC